MKRFEIGKEYLATESDNIIKVERRTARCIFVDKDGCKWRMRIKQDEEGNEFVVDSSLPHRYQWAATYSAKYEA